MAGNEFGLICDDIRETFLKRLCYPSVDLPSFGPEQALICCVLDQGVFEDIAGLWLNADAVGKLGVDDLIHQFIEPGIRPDRRQQGLVEFPSDD